MNVYLIAWAAQVYAHGSVRVFQKRACMGFCGISTIENAGLLKVMENQNDVVNSLNCKIMEKSLNLYREYMFLRTLRECGQWNDEIVPWSGTILRKSASNLIFTSCFYLFWVFHQSLKHPASVHLLCTYPRYVQRYDTLFISDQTVGTKSLPAVSIANWGGKEKIHYKEKKKLQLG